MTGEQGEKMKVEILQDCKASGDGVSLTEFWEGDIISVSEDFGKILLDAGYAGRYKEIRVNPPVETPEKTGKKTGKRRK
jgi:hypothetical protein